MILDKIASNLKKSIKGIIHTYGYDLYKIKRPVVDRTFGHMDTFLEYLSSTGINCKSIMDVGANQTIWSQMALRHFPSSQFTLIEPQEEMLSHLSDFCQNGEHRYYLNGAGPKVTEQYLTIWEDLAGSSFLPETKEELIKTGKQRKINITTIDHLIKHDQVPIPDLVKLDIQGYELEALKGANLLFGHTEVFILETSLFQFNLNMPELADVIQFMLERDYVVYDIVGYLRRPLDGALGQCDLVFVKKEGYLRRSSEWDIS